MNKGAGILCIYVSKVEIWSSKNSIMTAIQKVYSEFYRLLEEDKIYRDETLDFQALCAMLEVSQEEFDSYLMGELGYTGAEIIAKYRKLH